MAYGFALNMAGGSVHLEKTHHGIGSGKNIVKINGVNVVGMSKDGVQNILDNLRRTQNSIEFLLSDGGNVTFHPYSAPNDWISQKEAEKA